MCSFAWKRSTNQFLCRQLYWYATRLTAVLADSFLIFPQENIASIFNSLFNFVSQLNMLRYQLWRQFATTFPGQYTQQSEFLHDPGHQLTFTERTLP